MGNTARLTRGHQIYNLGFAKGRLTFSPGTLLGVINRRGQNYLVSNNYCDNGVSGGPLVDARGRPGRPDLGRHARQKPLRVAHRGNRAPSARPDADRDRRLPDRLPDQPPAQLVARHATGEACRPCAKGAESCSWAIGSRTHLTLYLTGGYLLLIVYASLYPLAGWRDSGGNPLDFLNAAWPRYYTGFDLATNVVRLSALRLPLCSDRCASGLRRWPAWLLATAARAQA
jgi:hypothetical protein